MKDGVLNPAANLDLSLAEWEAQFLGAQAA